MHVTIYSHNFAVTGYDRYGFDFLKQFGLANLGESDFRAVKANKWRRKMNQELLPTLKRVYSTRTKNGREFRFHINCLDMFKQAIANNPELNGKVTYTTVPLWTPKKLQLSVLSKYTPFDEQIPLIKYLSDPKLYSKVLSLRTGGGKMQHPKEPVLTYKDGWVPIGSLKPGDLIIRPNGKVAPVAAVFRHTDKTLYRFKLDDGRSTACGLEHLWGCYVNNAYSVKSTGEILELIGGGKTVYIPNISQYDGYVTKNPEYEVPPYLLGYLFSCAIYRDGVITYTLTHKSMKDRVTDGLVELGLSATQYGSNKNRFKIVAGEDEEAYAKFMATMREFGIAHQEPRKRKLPEYATNAVDAYRFTLYKGVKAGLGVKTQDMTFVVSSIYRGRIKTFEYLARSFGFGVNYGEHKRIKAVIHLNYRVRVVESIGQPTRVKSITQIPGTYDAVCIKVDSPDELYITRDFIVTHNTYCSLQAAVNVGGRIVISIETKFFKLWEEALLPTLNKKPNHKQILDLKTEEVLFVQGGKDLRALMDLALRDELGPYKVIVMASRTFTLYLEAYEAHPKEFGEVYPIHPIQFYEAVDAATRIKDELHLGLASNFKEELYLHMGNSISLSATLENGTFKDNVLGWMFPMETRAPDSELRKYIACTALMYNCAFPDKVNASVRGSTDYNHNEFEKWILKDKHRTEDYLHFVLQWVQGRYLRMREEGQGHKGCVFATSVDMATAMRDAIKKEYPNLKVTRYAASTGDSYEDARNTDIMVTTIQSFGTGFDLEGLICSFMTTAIDSPDSNIQTLGRLRELKKWPHITPRFDYLVCANLPKHRQYHENKMRLFAPRVKSHKVQWLNKIIK